jgi:methionyl-tRNA formyltransferase
MNIILFGEDIFTATVLQSLIKGKHVISAVICPLYHGSTVYKGLEQTANKNNIPFLRVKNVNAFEITDRLIEIKPDLIISVHIKVILLKEVYALAKKGAINIHPSLLPKYRGLSPHHQALLQGDKVTGVTIHFIDEKPDTGDIILQEKISLDENTSIFELQIKMLSIYKYLILQAVELIEKNEVTRIKQDPTQASWYGRLKRSDMEIDFRKTKLEIYNLIRAVSKPYGGAYHNGLTLWTSVIPDRQTENKLMDEFPFTGIYHVGDQVIIRLYDGVLQSDDFENKVL